MNNPTAPLSPLAIGYLAVLAIATVAAYSGIGGSEILRWDDNVYLNSELVQSLAFDNLLAMLYTQHHSNWHPLTTLSFALEHALWGQNAVYAKSVNIFLHLFNTFLFFLLSQRLLLLATKPAGAAQARLFDTPVFAERDSFALYASLFGASLFALHPQHVESVAWVSERKGLLCAAFYLAAMIAYLRAATAESTRHLNWTVVFMLLALMSKPMAVSLPIALMLLDVYPLRKVTRLEVSLETLKALLRGKSTYLLLALASVIITLLYQDPQGEAILGYAARLVNACAAYWHYLVTIFYPQNLSPFYPFLGFSLDLSLASLLPVLVFGGLAAAVIMLYRKNIQFPLVVFGFYAISLLPVIGIVKVGRQAMADRYAYLPTIWVYLLLGVAVFVLLKLAKNHLQRYFVGAVFIAVCAWLGLVTNEHGRHWRNDVALWQRVIEIYPDDASIAYVNLASAHDARGDKSVSEIEALIKKALELGPDEPYNLGAAANFYGLLDRDDIALELLLRMIEAAPYNYWARTQAADIYFRRNDLLDAGTHYLAAIQLREESEEVIFRLAWIDFKLKRYADALAKLELVTSAQLSERKAGLIARIQQILPGSSD